MPVEQSAGLRRRLGLFFGGEFGEGAGLGLGGGWRVSFVYNCRHGGRRLDKLICARAAHPPPLPAVFLKGAVAGAVAAAGCPVARRRRGAGRWRGGWRGVGLGSSWGGLAGAGPLFVASMKKTPMNKGRNRDYLTTKTTRPFPVHGITRQYHRERFLRGRCRGNPCLYWLKKKLAEREGFEPSVPPRGIKPRIF